ncbi:MAG: thiol peroxidase [Spirochaetia bacterium]|nr:thiol peroxidase [Spirochaetia bacterium]
MANITHKGNPIKTVGKLPAVGSKAESFTLVKTDLSEVSLKDVKGKKVLLNIFPSIDTSVCATSTRKFNAEVASIPGVEIFCISQDLPFALKRFCGAEGIDKVQTLSSFRSDFGDTYGVTIKTGLLAGLLSRSIVVIDEKGTVVYTEQVPEITQEPNYQAALNALK